MEEVTVQLNTSSTLADVKSGYDLIARNIGVGTMGVIINVFALVLIFMSSNLKTPLKISVISLTISDLTFLSTLVFHNAFQVFESIRYSPYSCKVFVFVTILSIAVSQEMTALMTLYNSSAVHLPFLFRSLKNNIHLSLLVSMSVWILTAVVLYMSIDLDIEPKPLCVPSLSVIGIHAIGFYVICGICIVIILAFNASIMWKFRSHFNRADCFTRCQKQNRTKPVNHALDGISLRGFASKSSNFRVRREQDEEIGNRNVAMNIQTLHNAEKLSNSLQDIAGESLKDRSPTMISKMRRSFPSALTPLQSMELKVSILEMSTHSNKHRASLPSSELILTGYTTGMPPSASREAATEYGLDIQTSAVPGISNNKLALPSAFSTTSTDTATVISISDTSGTSTTGSSIQCFSQNTSDAKTVSSANVQSRRRSSTASLADRNAFVTKSKAKPAPKKTLFRRGTVTLLILTMWCCLLTLPFVVYGIWLSTHDSHIVLTLSLHPFGVASSTLVGISSIGNPFLYTWRFIDWKRIHLRIREIFRRST